LLGCNCGCGFEFPQGCNQPGSKLRRSRGDEAIQVLIEKVAQALN
jgi:hypothetical protein